MSRVLINILVSRDVSELPVNRVLRVNFLFLINIHFVAWHVLLWIFKEFRLTHYFVQRGNKWQNRRNYVTRHKTRQNCGRDGEVENPRELLNLVHSWRGLLGWGIIGYASEPEELIVPGRDVGRYRSFYNKRDQQTRKWKRTEIKKERLAIKINKKTN